MITLSSKQKEAISALLIELFNAESIVEIQKLKLLNQVLSEYGISSSAINEARCLSLEESVSIICSIEDLELKKKLIGDFESIARRDGYCSPEEAILLQALRMAIIPAKGRSSVDALIFSMRPNKLNFDGKTATYIHPAKNLLPKDEQLQIDLYAELIMRHLDELVLLFRCFGYDFVYIPKLREDYGSNPELQEELKNFSFFFSNLPKDSVEKAIASFGVFDDSRRFSTAKFANMLFSGREHDKPENHDNPAFLIKISDSYVIDEDYVHNGVKETKHKKMYNFLYIPIVANDIAGIIDIIKEFFHEYIEMVDHSSYIVRPESSRRLRHFDLYQSLIARIASEGIYKSSPSLLIDLSHKTNASLIFEKAINGEDIKISIKSYVIEYLYSTWCSFNSLELNGLEAGELNIAAKDIWEFISSNIWKPDSVTGRDTDFESFKKKFIKAKDYLKTAFIKKKLDKYISNIYDYLPVKAYPKIAGPISYRIAIKDIKVKEIVDGRVQTKPFGESVIYQRINNFYNS